MRLDLGRYLFALVAIGFGLGGLIWHEFNTWQQLPPLAHAASRWAVIASARADRFYLRGTADFMPNWIPGHMFFAVITTVATLMIALFGVLIWFPAPASNPHDLNNWAGIVENFGICAAAWLVAEYLQRREPSGSVTKDRVDHLAIELPEVR